MKKTLFVAILAVIISTSVSGQTYYNMWRGNGTSGEPEFICNTSMTYGFTGIQFSTANTLRGYFNGSGRFLVLRPGSYSTLNIYSINNDLNSNSSLSIGTNGSIGSLGYQLRKLGTGSVLYADYCFGRNDDPILYSTQSKWLRLSGSSGLALWGNGTGVSNDTPQMFLSSNGTLKIGSIPTDYKLNVAGSIYSEDTGVKRIWTNTTDNAYMWFGTKSEHGLILGTNNQRAILISAGGNVFIGVGLSQVSDANKGKYRLFVDKGVLSEDFAIAPVSSWADHVFTKNYKLRSISELSNFIKTNGHLPNVPSAKTVAKEGYSQHDINKAVLEKIEELTLYIIQQDKKIKELESQLEK